MFPPEIAKQFEVGGNPAATSTQQAAVMCPTASNATAAWNSWCRATPRAACAAWVAWRTPTGAWRAPPAASTTAMWPRRCRASR
ncbi:hypothetical protein G6F61_015072 [Rhizopus arrhizus]|nr:hypothetical protein G6F61_015072 [Rhizopus arrhizus]